MKYLLITFILISSSLKAQKTEDYFNLSNSKMSWQKVYETNKSKEELIKYFEETNQFLSFQVIADTIFAKLKPQAVDPEITGVAGVPPLVNKCKYKGDVRIELKDKKYRVTFSNLQFVGDGEIIKKNKTEHFEEHFLRKDVSEYRPSFLKRPVEIYNYWFNTIFEIKTAKKDEW